MNNELHPITVDTFICIYNYCTHKHPQSICIPGTYNTIAHVFGYGSFTDCLPFSGKRNKNTNLSEHFQRFLYLKSSSTDSLLFLLLMLQTAYFLCTLLISKSIKLFCEANVAWSVYGVSTVIVCNGSYNIH